MPSAFAGPFYRRVAIAIAVSIGTILFYSILCILLSYSILDFISPHSRINAGRNQKSMNTSGTMQPNLNTSVPNSNSTVPVNITNFSTVPVNITNFNNTNAKSMLENATVSKSLENATVSKSLENATVSKSLENATVANSPFVKISNSTQVPIRMESPSIQSLSSNNDSASIVADEGS